MRAVRHRAADAGGRGGTAEAGGAAALLAPRLRVGLADFGAVEGVGGAGALIGAEGEHRLVDDGEIRLDAEDAVVGLDLADVLAGCVDDWELHRFLPPRRFVCRILTMPVVAPGTEPST